MVLCSDQSEFLPQTTPFLFWFSGSWGSDIPILRRSVVAFIELFSDYFSSCRAIFFVENQFFTKHTKNGHGVFFSYR